MTYHHPQIAQARQQLLTDWEEQARASLTDAARTYLEAGLPAEGLAAFLAPYTARWLASRDRALLRLDAAVDREMMRFGLEHYFNSDVMH